MRIQKYEGWTLGLAIISVILGEITSPKNIAFAQSQPDNTLGTEQSIVKPDMTINDSQCNPCDLIEGGAKRGNNLFHSFEKFNVNRSVYFSNPNGVDRIFTRVTGQSRSEILGKLGVLGNADLFLLNPNGIFFGPGASLDIKGSFISTTADSVVFENGNEFSASNPSNPALLTVNIPIGLRFRETAGDIINQSIAPGSNDFSLGLEVNSGKTLALIGGNITFLEGGVITAIDGRIELGSIASHGQVTLHPLEQGWTLSYEGVQNFQDINLTQLSQLSSIGNSNGGIQVTGRHIKITGGSQIFTQGTKEISVTATDTIEIEGKVAFPDFPGFFAPSGISNQTVTTEDSGLVTINTKYLIIQNGGAISTSTTGLAELDEMGNPNFTIATGNGGNLIINATESVELTGNSTEITSKSSSFGNAGDIIINTRNLSVRDNARVTAESSGIIFGKLIETGKGGNINISATESVQLDSGGLISVASIGMGKNAGNIDIETRALNISNSARILASTTGQGNAGNIAIKKADSVTLSNSTISTQSTGQGNAGNLTINTNGLTLRDKATISAETSSGTGGNIQINLQNLNVTRQSDITASTQTGQAGDLNIYATDTVNVNGDSNLSVEAKDGTAGNLSITANSLNLNQGTITAITQKPKDESANIRLRVADIIKLQNESLISATSTGTTNGGNITINTRFLIAYPPEGSNGSDITANSQEGEGGQININARGVFGTQIRNSLTGNNDITAFSELNPNLNGVIDFNTPDIDPTRGLVQFPTVVINPTTLISQDYCIQQDVSQLVISGRGGLPPSIIENISDRAIEIELVKPVNNSETQPQNRTNKPKSTTQAPIIPARGWVYNEYGEVILTAYDPTAKVSLPDHDKESVCPVQ